ncbi:ribose 5-phosphate isomerase B [Paenarthrobacter nicotinovorans]|uniref:RpiB/LacA/LacB family sugar-phosphate isomerase n=1 Tax=Paenarthrobacter nicotinovorans TaxID=29320 RepID=UPI0027844C95|nr:RpiB/LacA/LacB family sugar-phosphate isomerase [Paenarthrobacter nicotinovorans]MDP9933749.1 ribose 5-phosphate isomerase B [Paenarthrobacter nicotinovorans]
MRIALSNDHAGYSLKLYVKEFIESAGHEVIDVGTQDDKPVDFPLMTQRVTRLVTKGEADRGLLVCGTGVGAAIAANKVPGIRAAVIHDTYVARQGVEHDDVNVACLGAWIVGQKIAEDVITAYLDATFSTDSDFRRRVAQLAEMEAATQEASDLPGGHHDGAR